MSKSWFHGRVRRSGTAIAGDGAIANTGIMYVGVAPPSPLVAARERLAELVAVQWRDETARRTLYNPESMPVVWHPTRDRTLVADHTTELEFRGDDLTPLVTAFRTRDRRRVVIIGAAGSGKTTLAVQLVRDLLDSRKDHPDDRVPVLLSASTWSPEFTTLRQWAAHRLAHDYRAIGASEFGPEGHGELVGRAQVLLVIDGLDELPEPALASFLQCLNDFSDRDDQLILTCRTDQYRQAVREAAVAASALVVEPDPLTPSGAADYLESCLAAEVGEGWGEVLAALRDPESPPEALAEVVSSPLGLWLVRIAYTRADPRELLDRGRFADAAAVREHLYHVLIPALIRLRPADPDRNGLPRRQHEPADVERWLGYLAALMGTTTDLAWWRLARMTGNPFAVFRLWWGFSAVVSTCAFLISPTAAEIPLPIILIGGILFGLAAALGAGMAIDQWADCEPGHARRRLTGDLAELVGVIRKTFVTDLLTVVVLIAFLHVVGIRPGLVIFVGGVLVCLLLAVGTGIGEWAEMPAATDQATTPSRHLVADRKLNLIRVVTIGVLVGLAVSAAFSMVVGIAEGIVYGLLGGLGAAIVRGAVVGDHRAWLAYVVTVANLSRRRLLPRKLMPFLDDAHRLGLLRAVGSVYQFRHAGLQDYLARTYRDRS